MMTLKAMRKVVNQASDGFSKSLSIKIMRPRGQFGRIISDAREQAETIVTIVERGIVRAVGHNLRSGLKNYPGNLMTRDGAVYLPDKRMINGYPTEEELRGRILRQLQWRDQDEAVSLLWHGYLAALLEWGILEVDVYKRLSDILSNLSNKYICEIFSDEQLTTEQEAEAEVESKIKSSISNGRLPS